MLTQGTLLQDRYRVARKLASGGMGTVYEATDERLDAVVAIKETAFEDEELRGHFEREARLLARLSHPALPRVSDHFAEGGGQFLVMQFVEGEDLEAMRRRQEGGAFPVARVLAWADELLDALEYLHSRQPPVIHRDIKPQNLKLGARDRIILLDFGLAKGYASRTSPHAHAPSVHGGTPAYAPLEQLEGTGTDARSDLFSLAVTLYQLMTGVLPPAVMTRLNALHNNRPDPLRPAHEVSPHVSPEVSAVLQGAMSVARDERPASAAEMRGRLLEAGRRQESFGAAPTLLMTPTVLDDAAQDDATGEPTFDSEGPTQSDAADLTATQKHHLEYWTAFRDYMERRGSSVTSGKPQTAYWMWFAVGRSGFGLIAYNGMRDKWIGVELYLAGTDAKSHFQLLHRERERIESEIGTTLEWQEKPSQKNSAITLKRPNVDPTNRQDWPQQHEWLLENLEAFHKAFAPRIKNLRAGDYAPVVETRPADVEIAETVPASPAPPHPRRAWLIGGLAAVLLVGVVAVVLALKVFRASDSPGRKGDGTGASNEAGAVVNPSTTDANSQTPGDAANFFLSSGEASRTLEGHNSVIHSIIFSPDGTLLASGSSDLRLWDARTGELRQTVSDPGHRDAIPVAFSASGQTLAVILFKALPSSKECEIVLLDNLGGKLGGVRRAINLEGCPAFTFALSPDGSTLATVSRPPATTPDPGMSLHPDSITLWDMRTGESLRKLEGHQETTYSLAFSPDGATLAGAGDTDGTVRLWNIDDGRVLKTIRAHDRTNAVAFSPDGKTLATGGHDGRLILWDAARGTRVRTLTYDGNAGDSSAVDAIAFSPDGGLVACGGSSARLIKIWDARTGELKASLKIEELGVTSLAFSPDGAVLVCGTGNGDIVLFNVVRMDASRTPDTKPTPRPFVIRAVPDEMERRRRSALSVLDQ